MPFKPHAQEQVTRRSITRPRLALTGKSDYRTVAHSGGDGNVECLGAGGALQGETALHPTMGVFQREGDFGLDIRTSYGEAGSCACTAPSAEQRFEEIAEAGGAASGTGCAEEIAKVLVITVRLLPSRWRSEVRARLPVCAEPIIALALLGIGQDRVGFIEFFEFFLGRFIPGIDIRVILASEYTVGFFDFLFGRGTGDAENFIVVAKLYRHLWPPAFANLIARRGRAPAAALHHPRGSRGSVRQARSLLPVHRSVRSLPLHALLDRRTGRHSQMASPLGL